MRIGILICDDVNPLLREVHSSYEVMFTEHFNRVDPECELKFYRVIDGELPQQLDECEGYITSGSKYGVNDDYPWIQALEQFVRRLKSEAVPYVGICFGHQMLAKALGGEVTLAPVGWGVGVHYAHIFNNKPWMQPAKGEIKLLVSHKDQISSLPEHAQVLAGSNFCPTAMMQIGETMLGIQGHPEFCKQYSQDLMNVRRDIIPPDVIEMGMRSLNEDIDGNLVTGWILSFIRQANKRTKE
ncbi:GMP synthase [Parasalinivibrio latis]|uniref:glutamine amidotransferase-related protein n=1 Tax=Parasalinivibrio latis TaxID=2952610 RepID=UPI0030E18A24